MKRYNLKKLAIASAFLASAFLPVASAFAVDQPNQGGDPGQNQPGGPDQQNPFDGRAYFIWDCGGKVCYHLFDNLKSIGQGVNYIKNTEITDQSGNGGTYTFKQEVADWALPIDFVDNNGKVLDKWTGKSVKEILAPVWEGGASIRAIAFGDGVNSISTNEDQMFKVIIYRNSYKAVTIGDSADDYTYFPAEWDVTSNPESTFNPEIDISGTTVDKPARVDTYLKEPLVKIKADGIASIRPINVNSSALSYVQKDMNVFEIRFNSSYYDHVIFELTGTDGRTYYLMVARTAITVSNDFFPDQPHVFATQVMYPTGSADGSTYSVVATVVGKDGTKKIHTLKAEDFIRRYEDQNQGREVTENLGKSYPCGKGLSCTQYSITVGNIRQIEGVYVNVIKNGASVNDVYPGTFSGSNHGTYWSSEARKVIYE